MNTKNTTVERIREFNRFYLPTLDLLGNHYLGSQYSPTESRVLYEVYTADGCNAAHIAKTMNIDKSYLSRILKNHEKSGYLVRIASKKDSRSYELHLTDRGKVVTEEFIDKSNRQIGDIIAPLTVKECERLKDALNTVTDILQRCRDEQK